MNKDARTILKEWLQDLKLELQSFLRELSKDDDIRVAINLSNQIYGYIAISRGPITHKVPFGVIGTPDGTFLPELLERDLLFHELTIIVDGSVETVNITESPIIYSNSKAKGTTIRPQWTGLIKHIIENDIVAPIGLNDDILK